jgi:regulator of RNase E activity RraA
VRWNCDVEVFATTVKPGQLIHADKHGFLIIPEEDQDRILEASVFMDRNECNTVIAAARSSAGRSLEDTVEALGAAGGEFDRATAKKFGRGGEW